jgi:hypothetical protein
MPRFPGQWCFSSKMRFSVNKLLIAVEPWKIFFIKVKAEIRGLARKDR